MKVRLKRKAFIGTTLHEPGDVVDVETARKDLPSWMEPMGAKRTTSNTDAPSDGE